MPARVEELARTLIEQHGPRAAYAAVERLNQSIDERDQSARDFWAQVVHAIHEYQRSVDTQRQTGRNPGKCRKNQRPGTDRSVAEWVRKNALTHCPGQDLQAAFLASSIISLLRAKRPFSFLASLRT